MPNNPTQAEMVRVIAAPRIGDWLPTHTGLLPGAEPVTAATIRAVLAKKDF